jgi:hypothetical protein
MVPPTFADRLARLTFLCSEISKIKRGDEVSTQQLERLLVETEALSQALRREIERRGHK